MKFVVYNLFFFIAEKLSKNMQKRLFLAISQNFAQKVHNSASDRDIKMPF
jgi:hypothetical protein